MSTPTHATVTPEATASHRPVLNTRLLDEGLAFIRANPDAWDQTNWTRCLAGVVALEIAAGVATYFEESPDWVGAGPEDPPDHIETGGVVSICNRATRLLGLTEPEADKLFRSSVTTLGELEETAQQIIGQRARAG